MRQSVGRTGICSFDRLIARGTGRSATRRELECLPAGDGGDTPVRHEHGDRSLRLEQRDGGMAAGGLDGQRFGLLNESRRTWRTGITRRGRSFPDRWGFPRSTRGLGRSSGTVRSASRCFRPAWSPAGSPQCDGPIGHRAAGRARPGDLACPADVGRDRVVPAGVAGHVVAVPDQDRPPVAEDVDVLRVRRSTQQGTGPARFQTKPASLLPGLLAATGPHSHRQATTS
jgi:hypothetical protein